MRHRLFQDDFINARNRTDGFCRSDEVARCKASARRVLPAHQRFGTAKLQRFGIYLRLIGNGKLVGFQRLEKLVSCLLVGEGDVAQYGIEDHHAVSAHALGLVECDACVYQDIAHAGRSLIHPGDANASTDATMVFAIAQWLAQGAHDFIGKLSKCIGISVPVGDQRKLIATNTGDEIVRPGDALKHSGTVAQHGVAR